MRSHEVARDFKIFVETNLKSCLANKKMRLTELTKLYSKEKHTAISQFRNEKRNLGRVSSRSPLWDRYWGQYDFSSIVLSPVMAPQATAR